MVKHPGFENYKRTVLQKFGEVKSAIATLVNILPADAQKETKVRRATELAHRLTNLLDAVGEHDKPAWAAPLMQRLQTYVANKGSGDVGQYLLQSLMATHDGVEKQDWRFDDDKVSIDLDSAYREAYEKSKLPELFDQMAAYLQQLIESGEVDSVRAMRSLEQLIALLKKNRKGSYFSTWTTWQVVSATWRNVARHYARDNKAVGPLIKGIEDTLVEMGTSWEQFHQEMREKIKSAFGADISMLNYTPSIGLPSPIGNDNETSDKTGSTQIPSP